MLLLTHTDAAFAKLILEQTPRIGQMPRVQEIMAKYTSGYLTAERLAVALTAGTFPMVELAVVGGGDSGGQSGDTIQIDSTWFEFFKKGHPSYVLRVPITVFHELAHWGYWKGQQEGHPSDEVGRKHDNHAENMSPLNAELLELFQTILVL